MATGSQPSFHLCPDTGIPPPPRGHLELGSILHNLEITGVHSPLNNGDTIPVPDAELRPRDKPFERRGFSRKLGDLRKVQGSIWAKLLGSMGPSATVSLLRERRDDDILFVEKLLHRGFHPTLEYTANALQTDGVAFYIQDTNFKKPVYLVTGLMWVEGARISSSRSRTKDLSGEARVADPSGEVVGTGGLRAGYLDEASASSSVEDSDPFILGMRVQKIWWDRDHKRHDSLHIAGAVLGEDDEETVDLSHGMKIADDFVQGTAYSIVDESSLAEGDPVIYANA